MMRRQSGIHPGGRRFAKLRSAFGRGPLPTLVLPLLGIGLDLGCRMRVGGSVRPSNWSLQDAGVYLLGLLWSLGSWLLVAELLARLTRARPWLRRALAAGLGLCLGGLLVATLTYREELWQTPSWQVLRWALGEPELTSQLGRWILGPFHLLGVLACAGACALVLGRPAAPTPLPRAARGRVAAGLGGAAYVAVSVLTLGTAGFQDPLPLDANAAAAFALFGLARTTGEKHLVVPVRPALPSPPDGPRPNVLLILHASLRADAQFPDLGYHDAVPTREVAPFAAAMVGRRDEGYFAFVRARTNSTATESSVPAILSGVDPGGDPHAYGRVTSLWAMGKAARASTFLFAAVDWSFGHFDEYFLDRNVDVQRTGRELGAELVGNGGVDDALVTDAVIAQLRLLAAARQPFVGVVHFNATHAPYWAGPEAAGAPRAGIAGYRLAARYLDRQLERLVGALAQLGLAQSTVVVSTSDHGDVLDPHHGVQRLGAFYEYALRVPIWIRVPPRLLVSRPDWARNLDAWNGRNVQNLDLLPTLWDVLELGDPAVLRASAPAGRSLLRPVPAGADMISGQSTCAFRAWQLDGFFLVAGQVKVI
ncbi:MAG: sulfatase-like hydrolase/transferase, partial [Deltaproteobacteria bacterium]|nr:sulfatase-like hydrolase/transferase [Deltaproteobacteria bacterium]